MGAPKGLTPVIAPEEFQSVSSSSSSASPKGLKPVIEPSLMPQVEYKGINPVTANVAWNLQIGKGDERIGAVEADDDLNDGEKDWLRQNVNYLSPEEFRKSQEVMAGRDAKQKDWAGTSIKNYYFDSKGIPVALGEFERPPDDAKINSLWGTQEQALDDSGLTTFAKSLWNGFMGIVKTPGAIAQAIYGLGGGTGNLDFYTASKNLYDKISFETDPESSASTLVDEKAFESMSEFFNGENWSPSTQNITGLAGQAIGSVLQFMVGGRALGIKGPVKFGTASVPKVVASYAPSVGLASTIVLSDAIDAAEKEGLTGREKYAVALVNAVGQGILEMAIGGAERGLLGSTVKAGVQREISQSAVKAFKDAGGQITPQALKAAFNATTKNTVRLLPVVARKFGGQAGMEGVEELTQQLWSNSLSALNAKVHGRDAQGVFDPKALKEYFTSALGGFLGGLGGGGVNLVNGSLLDDARGASVYRAVQDGKQLELRNGLDQMLRKGQITLEQREMAEFRIQSYERYDKEVGDIVLDDKQKQDVFNLTWKDENVRQQIKNLESNEQMTEPIKKAKMKVLEGQSAEYVNKIASIIKSAQPEAQKPEEPKKEEKKPEGKAEQPPLVPMSSIQTVAKKRLSGEEFTDEDFKLNMEYPRHVQLEEDRIGRIAHAEKELREGKVKRDGNIAPEAITRQRIAMINQEIDAQIRKLDEQLLGKQQSAQPTPPAPKQSPKMEALMEEKGKRLTWEQKVKQRDFERVNTVLKDRPGFVAHEQEDWDEALAGKETLKGEQLKRRKEVKQGDVLDVQLIEAPKGQLLRFPGQASDAGYKYSMTVHPEGEKVDYEYNDRGELVIKNNVGSIKYTGGKAMNKKLIHRLLKEGREVKVVVTYSKDGLIKYRVISKEPNVTPEVFAETARNVTISRAKAIKAIESEVPSTFPEAVLRWALQGGKVRVKDWEHYTGFHKYSEVPSKKTGKRLESEEYKAAKWYLTENGTSVDNLVNETEELYPDMFRMDEQDRINELFDVLSSYSKKSEALEAVLEMQANMRESHLGFMPNSWEQKLEDESMDLAAELIADGVFDPTQEYTQEEIDKILYNNEQTNRFTETKSDEVNSSLTKAFDSGEIFAQNEGQESEEELETFYARPPDVAPPDVSERPSQPTLLSEQDAMEKITAAESIDDLNDLMDALDRDKIWSKEIGNAVIKRQNEINAGFRNQKPEDDEIDYHENPRGPLASTDPELFEHIQQRMAKLFPNVHAFSTPEAFQEYVDRVSPGQQLDLTKIGAAIGEAVYIDPKRARQSTTLHEYAHYYWNALPADNSLKKQLESMFGSEEAAVEAIGNIGTDAAKIKLSGSKLTKVLNWVQQLWAEFKNAFWPSSVTKEQAAKIMADRIWKNADKVQAKEAGQPGPIKYMDDDSSDAQRDAVIQLQRIADQFNYDDATHTYTDKRTGVEFPSVTTVLQSIPEYAYSNTGAKTAAGRGKKLHKVAEAIAKGLDPRAAAKEAGLEITDKAIDSLIEQIDTFIQEVRKKGQVLSETIVANSDFGIAGMSDITVISKDGKVSIFDFKSSERSAHIESYDKPYRGKVSKKQNHGTQLGLYARLVEADNQQYNTAGMPIDELGVVPITYKVNKDGVITSVEVEDVIPVDYNEVRGEVDRVINKHLKARAVKDKAEIEDAEPLTDEELAEEMQWDESEIKQQLAELRASPIDPKEKRAKEKELKQALYNIQDAKATYRRDLEKVQELVDENFDPTKMSLQELVDAKNMFQRYDNLRQNKYLARIEYEIGERLRDLREAELAQGPQSEGDIGAFDVLTTALSDIKQDNPAVQEVGKKYLGQIKMRNIAQESMSEQVDKLIKDVLKEKNITIGDKTSAFVFASKNVEKVYGNLFRKGEPGELLALKDPNNPQEAATLSKAELALLKHVTENMQTYEQRQAESERGTWQGFYPQLNKNFFENYYSQGVFFARAAEINKELPDSIYDVKIEFKDPVTKVKSQMKYGDVLKKLDAYAKGSKIRTTMATFMLQQAKNRAVEMNKKLRGASADIEMQKFGLSATGEMISKFQRISNRPMEEQSMDLGRAYKEYMNDMIHIDHMQPIMPELTAVQSYYKQRRLNPGVQLNMEKFLDYWINGDILGKHYVGKLGRKVDDAFKFMQAWTYMSIMSFNFKGGLVLNAIVGKFNQFRATGGKQMAIGEKRYFAEWKKSHAVLRHYRVITSSAEDQTQYSSLTLFKSLANAPVNMAEHWIQGAAFLGQMTPEEWANFDDKGQLIDKSKEIKPSRIAQMEKNMRDQQGKYAFEDKRMYKHYATFAAVMGFKGWMPDMLKERLGKEYIDSYNVTHKGSYRSLPYIMRDLWMMMSDTKNWVKSTDIDVQNNKKNIREAMSFILLLSLYAMASDDKEERKKGNIVWSAFTQVAGMFNLSSWEFIATQPMPALGTIKQLINTAQELFEVYEAPGKYGDKGDSKFWGNAYQILPYHKILETPTQAAEIFMED